MRRVRIQNPLLDKTYKTFIASDYVPATNTTTLTVLSNVSFSPNDLLVIGNSTEEMTEIKKLNSVSSTTSMMIASQLNFSHQKGTSVYKSLWDNISLERRASSSAVWSEITQSAIQWDNDRNETVYYDSNGIDTSQYRYRFFNSVTATYSEYSPTLTGAGFNRQQVGYISREIRSIVNDKERKIVTDDEIVRLLNKAQDIIYSHNPRYFFLLVDVYQAGTGIAATAATNVYSLLTYTTYGHLETVRYQYNSGGTNQIYHLEKKSSVEFDRIAGDLTLTDDDWARCYKLLPADSLSSNGYIQIFPKTKNTGVGTLYPNYYEKMAALDTVDDETQVPLPNLLEDFAISQIEKIKGNETKAKIYENFFFGPADRREGFEDVTGIKLLDQLNAAQIQAAGQPRSLWNYKGQNAIYRLYGNYASQNHDYIKENYMD